MNSEAATDAKRFAMIAAATALLAVVFRLGLGSRWFSFYGLATLVTLALPAVAVVLHMRATEQKRWRWPI